MNRRKQRRAYLTNKWFRMHSGGPERPTVPKLPPIQLPQRTVAPTKPVRLGVDGLQIIAGLPNGLDILFGLAPAPIKSNGVRHERVRWNGSFVYDQHAAAMDDDEDEDQTAWESFRRQRKQGDRYMRMPERSWKWYRRAKQYKPRHVSDTHRHAIAA